MEWVTRDGRTLQIDEMTDDHLENCINHLANRFIIPGTGLTIGKREVTDRLPAPQIRIDEYNYMRRVLANRILAKAQEEENAIHLGKVVNPLEYL